jgi:hypothetical protein
MVYQDEVDTLFEVLTEAHWLRTAGETREKVEGWVRISLR